MELQTPAAKPLEERFTISYDAKDDLLANHQIDARVLGEAIVAVTSLIEDTARLISNGSADVKLKVTAPAKEGSLEVVFALLSDPSTIAKVLGILGLGHAATFTGSTVIELVQRIKNRKITSIEYETQTDEAVIHTEDGSFKASKQVAALVSNTKIRESLHKVIQAPLSGKKDAQFKVLDASERIVKRFEGEEINEFTRLPKGSLEETHSTTDVVTITFAQVNFGAKTGWRIVMPDGAEHSATIKDEAFLDKVNRNQQAFQKDDRYEIRLKTTTTYRPSRNTIDRAIIEVIRNWDSPNRNR